MKRILIFILKILSEAVLKKYRPVIIGVTGNVGKTSTKEAIYTVLTSHFPKVRRGLKTYNNEIGVPLTILGFATEGKSFFGWLINILKGIKVLIADKNYPSILILEMGADKPGDIEYLTRFVPPFVGVMTAIGEIPVHIVFFKNREDLIKEKSILIRKIPKEGKAILNFDDPDVKRMKELSKADILTFGFKEGANLRATDISTNYQNKEIIGLNFKLNYEGSSIPVRLPQILGKHQIYSGLAAAACGITFGMNLIDISEALKNFQSPPGRLKLLKGIKQSFIIDDSYNASPKATLAALEIIKEIKAKRKIVVLGDMLELGTLTEKAHRGIGAKAAKIADLIFVVGEAAKFIADEARKKGFDREKVFEYSESITAGLRLQSEIRKGDVILVKGSQGVRMEKIVKEIMAEPEKAEELLVRQDSLWQKKH